MTEDRYCVCLVNKIKKGMNIIKMALKSLFMLPWKGSQSQIQDDIDQEVQSGTKEVLRSSLLLCMKALFKAQ